MITGRGHTEGKCVHTSALGEKKALGNNGLWMIGCICENAVLHHCIKEDAIQSA